MRSNGKRASEISSEPVRPIEVEVGDVEDERTSRTLNARKKVKRPGKLFSSKILHRRLLKKWNNTVSRIYRSGRGVHTV